MNSILSRLLAGIRLKADDLDTLAALDPAVLEHELEALDAGDRLLGWRPPGPMDGDASIPGTESAGPRAVIDIALHPEWIPHHRLISEKIASEELVESCYLWSGRQDILVFARPSSVSDLVRWLNRRLRRIRGVSTYTAHFLLLDFEEQGYQRLRAEREGAAS